MSRHRHVPFLDLRAAYDELREELDAAYHRVMDSGWYVLGEEVEAFEREFAQYCGTGECVAVASGLDALTLTLRALGVGAGDEVVVPGSTYIATWLAVSAVGARPVAVDAERGTGMLDLTLLERAIGSRTRAVIPVHLYGQPEDIGALSSVVRAHDIPILADAAQAHGASVRGVPVGRLGRAAAFSFYPSKNLGAFGDAGAIVTDDRELAADLRLHRNYGSPRKYEHLIRGANSRLDPLQAAFLRVKLPHLDSWNERRRAIAARYRAEIDAGGGVVALPRSVPGAESVWHVFAIGCTQRDNLREHLQSRGIETLIHYPVPPHLSQAYASDRPWPPLPEAERWAQTTLSLPIGPHLEDDAVGHVIDAVNEFTRPKVRDASVGRHLGTGAERQPRATAVSARPAGDPAPRVSCLMTTYMHERFIERALGSLLSQDYPARAMEIILVDDGSTDRTPELVKPYLDRIRFIRKPNAGLIDSVNLLLSEATGDYVALFSGDDETPPDALRRRVELLQRRPEVGLCFGDMEVIDADSEVIIPSWATEYDLHGHRGHVLGELLKGNFVSGGTIVARSSLIPRFHPIPPEVPWEDWWIALRVAEVAELDYVDGPVSRYRLHGNNMIGGSEGAKRLAITRDEVSFRRFLMRTIDSATAGVDDLLAALAELRRLADAIACASGQVRAQVYDVSEADRARARVLASDAVRAGARDTRQAIGTLFRALGHDPECVEAGAALDDLVARHRARAAAADELSQLLGAVRSTATLAFADELSERPSLLAGYAGAVGPADPATLIIYAPDADPALVERDLLAALEQAGIDEVHCPDLVALVVRGAQALELELADRVQAVLTERRLDGPFAALPVLGPTVQRYRGRDRGGSLMTAARVRRA